MNRFNFLKQIQYYFDAQKSEKERKGKRKEKKLINNSIEHAQHNETF